MSLTINEYVVKLINKILFANSQEEVKRSIEEVMKGLEQSKVYGHFADPFTDKMVSELSQFNPMHQDAQQWSNIRLAKIIFNRTKQRLNTPVH